MKQRKGVLSCIFVTMSMILLTLSVYATNNDNSTNMKADSSQIYQMTLPTNLDFTIDPYGLTMIGNSTMSLEEILSNPPGLVTSAAIEIKNSNDVGVFVEAEVYLKSELPIKLGKTKEEAKKDSDLYIQLLPVEVSKDYPATPVTVLDNGTGTVQSGNLIKFKLEESGKENDTYQFTVDGYANPNSTIWKEAAYTQSQKPVELCMKFSFEYEDIDESSEEETENPSTEDPSSEEPSSEDSSSNEDSSSEDSSSEKPSDGGETTTVPATVNNVIFSNGAFALKIPKSEVSARPTDISLIYENEEYNLRYYAVVQITEDKEYYIITVTDFPEGEGVCPLKVFAGNKLIYDKATVTFP